MTDVPTLMPVPSCNVRIGRMQFYHPDQAKAREFAKRPKQEGLMTMLIAGIVLMILGVFGVSYRVFSPSPPPPRQGQAAPAGPGLIRRVLPYAFLIGGGVMTFTAIPLMDAPNRMLDDKGLLRDCSPN